ncbi:MAG: type II secretion system F family protein [Lachnospiraceae bacterium]|nr:type II secretion system F family protein [Lachnospiraceae bacterium]
MITYQYKAVSADGANVSGIVEATDEFAAVAKIKNTCPIVLKVTPVKEKKGLLTMELGHKKVNAKALSVMCSQFAIILKSGVTISRCMEMIGEQTEDKQLKKMLIRSAEDVGEGNSVANSFEKNCDGLPITFIETIRAGEQSGTLERSFETLESYYSKSYKTSQKVKQALTYPIFVIIVAIIVVIVVMVKVVPTISSTFGDLGGDIPGITKFLIATSEFFQKYIWLIIAAIAALIIGFKVYTNSEKGRYEWNKCKLKMPAFGKINLLNGASQFANTMSALLTAGLSISQALEVTAKTMDNYVLSLETNKMAGKIEEGRRLGDCMRQAQYYPPTLTEMSAIGEETGELESTLETIGSYFDNEAEHATNQAISKLEPTIMVFLALFAGFIVIAIYLPMFTMYNLM